MAIVLQWKKPSNVHEGNLSKFYVVLKWFQIIQSKYIIASERNIKCLLSANRTKTWSLSHLLPGLSVAAIADSMMTLHLHR